jgi:hypothetical protein
MSLHFDIGANVAGAVDGFKRVTKEFDILKVSLTKITPALQSLQQRITAMGGGVKTFAVSFNNVPSAVNNTTNALNRVPGASNTATQSLVNLSRVAQDMPYGFLGIANNLNPLLESFQRLKAETGSSKEAFKALGASLSGAGGIGLALGIVSSLLVVFGDRLFGAKKRAEESKAAIDELNSSLDAQKRRIEGVASAISFLNRMNKLNLQLNFGREGNVLGIEGTIGTILEKEIPALESELVKARALSDKLEEDRRNGLVKEKDFNEGIKKLNEQRLGIQKDLSDKQNEVILLRSERDLQSRKDQEEAAEELKRILEKQKANYEKYVNDIISRGKTLADFFKDIAVVPTFSPLDSTVEQFQKANKLLQDYASANLIIKIPVAPDYDSVVRPEDKKFPSATFEQMFGKAPVSKDPTDFSLLEALRDWADIEAAKKEAQRLAEQLGSTIKSAMADSLSGIGTALGEALTGGDVGSAFQAFAQSIGTALQAIGKQLIAIGTAALLAKEALKKLFANPAVAIAAGVALVAAGAAMKNVLGKGLSGRAAGGGIAANTPYLVGENGPEMIFPSSSGKVIPNHSLSGLAGKAAQMIEVFVTGRFDGDSMVLAVEKTIQKQGRY